MVPRRLVFAWVGDWSAQSRYRVDLDLPSKSNCHILLVLPTNAMNRPAKTESLNLLVDTQAMRMRFKM